MTYKDEGWTTKEVGSGQEQRTSLQPLNPADLLGFACVGEDDRKIIDEEEQDEQERKGGAGERRGGRQEEGEHDLVSSAVALAPPLAPAYYPGRQVRRLWQGGTQVGGLRRRHGLAPAQAPIHTSGLVKTRHPVLTLTPSLLF